MIVSIASHKGGTGKTTTSISLSAGLARQGKKVLVIDVDPQAFSSRVLLHHYTSIPVKETLYRTIQDRKPLAIYKTLVPNLDIVPSHIFLSKTEVELTKTEDDNEVRLKRELDIIKARYDYVFIDCPPSLSWLTVNAFTASDKVIVVVSPSYFAVNSIELLSKTVAKVKESFNTNLQIGSLLFTMSDLTPETTNSLRILREKYGTTLLNTIIPRSDDLQDANFNKQDIFAYDPNGKGAAAYRKLIQELFLEKRR